MIYNDPSRSVAPNGHLCWKDSNIALPTLDFIPEQTRMKDPPIYDELDPDYGLIWTVILIIPSPNGGWDYTETRIEWQDIPALMSHWRDNPEEALRRWWGRDIEKAIEGYERAKERPIVSPTPMTHASAEELGF
jgi:hypothetical protein